MSNETSEPVDIIAQAIHKTYCDSRHLGCPAGPDDTDRKVAQSMISALLAAGTVERWWRWSDGVLTGTRKRDDDYGLPTPHVVQRRVFPLTEEWTTT